MMPVTAAQALLAFVLFQRLGELWLSRRNAERLLAAGGVEHGAGHYPYLVVMHGAWLSALVLTVPEDAAVDPVWLSVFATLQMARIWVIASLGRYWTTRIITVRDAPLVRRGPYRYVRHPNYIVVAAEIAVVPMIFGAWLIAILFSGVNLILLRERIRVEEEALAPRRTIGPG